MLSRPDFGFATTATEAADVFGKEIRGKSVLITGISPNSIGSALAHSLAPHAPSHLILASRTFANIQAVIDTLPLNTPQTQISAITLELSSLTSVRAAAEEVKRILGKRGGLDVLFNNAGININWKELTKEGVEMQFATNHLGGFLLTNLLLPMLSKGGRGRVINTASEAHRISPVRFSDVNQTPGVEVPEDERPRKGLPEGMLRGDGGYEPAVAYGQSKTANVLFCVGLNANIAATGVKSSAVSPGNIMTNLIRDVDPSVKTVLEGTLNDKEYWKSADQGAATLVVAGFDPKFEVADGVYLDDCKLRRPAKWAQDPEMAERLWKMSEELIGERFNIGGAGGGSRL